MTRLEMVETLRVKAGVSYDDAREALEKNNWDMLDAAIALKRDTDFGTGASKTGAVQGTQTDEAPRDSGIKDFASGIGDKFSVGMRFLLNILAKGEGIRLEIVYRDEVIGSLSLTVLLLLLIFCWYIPVILGIFCFLVGFRFRFSNKTLVGKTMNSLGSKVKEDAKKELEMVSRFRKED